MNSIVPNILFDTRRKIATMATSAVSAATGDSRSKKLHVLIADDEMYVRDVCKDVVHTSGMRAVTAATAEEAVHLLSQNDFDLLITDIRMPDMGGMALIKQCRQLQPHIGIIIITGYGTINSAVEAVRSGAIDFITKPFVIDDLVQRLRNAALLAECNRNRIAIANSESTAVAKLIGRTAVINYIRRQIFTMSNHDYPVLILGETGTGKEVVARAIHFSGCRAPCPFVPVDCATLPPTLVESELFGHVQGAFTGAVKGKLGLVESAHTGTLFLDEIGELPKELQGKLLRVLQEREVRRVGSTVTKTLDIRIIAATNRDLKAEVRAGNFREDLFYRLNVVNVELPPLRQRIDDLPLLVSALLNKLSNKWREITSISPEVWPKLYQYDWPGNIRELENCIERALAHGSGPILQAEDFALVYDSQSSAAAPIDDLVFLAEVERRTIKRALALCDGDKLTASKRLGIGKTTLYRKLKEYGFEQTSKQC
jgi:DNA-binding NtrC family response regulator